MTRVGSSDKAELDRISKVKGSEIDSLRNNADMQQQLRELIKGRHDTKDIFDAGSFLKFLQKELSEENLLFFSKNRRASRIDICRKRLNKLKKKHQI